MPSAGINQLTLDLKCGQMKVVSAAVASAAAMAHCSGNVHSAAISVANFGSPRACRIATTVGRGVPPTGNGALCVAEVCGLRVVGPLPQAQDEGVPHRVARDAATLVP